MKKALLIATLALVGGLAPLLVSSAPNTIGSCPAFNSTSDQGKACTVTNSGTLGWLFPGGVSGSTGPTNDLVAYSNNSGSLKDSGIPLANVVLTSRQVIAGTGITVTPQQQLTSDITVAMSTTDNQALTVVGTLTASGQLTVQQGTEAFTASNGNNKMTVPTGGTGSLLVVGSTNLAIFNDSTTSVTLHGTNTNDSAATGYIGETLFASIAPASALSLTGGVAKTITTITLTAGDWDVRASIAYTPGATTTYNQAVVAVSKTTNAVPAASTLANPTSGETYQQWFQPSAVPVSPFSFALPTFRVSVSSSTPLFLVAFCGFGTSTMSASGYIEARRMR